MGDEANAESGNAECIQTGDVFPTEKDAPPSQRDESHNRLDERGFTHPIPAQNRYDRALLHVQADSLKHIAVTIIRMDIPNF